MRHLMREYPAARPEKGPRWFVRTGQFRNPDEGEFYLSGAIPEVYRARVALRNPYEIMTPAGDRVVLNHATDLLRLAVGYLEHPDVDSIPFSMPVGNVARSIRRFLRDVEGK